MSATDEALAAVRDVYVPIKAEAAKLPAPKKAEPLGVIRSNLTRVSLDWLEEEPPPREFLFEAEDPETDGETTVGVLPSGIVGMLAGQGGVGKSELAIHAAVSVASGAPFLEWIPTRTGRVLLAMGEEDVTEARRRIHRVCRGMNLTEDQRRKVAERVYVAPLAGNAVSLLERDANGNTAESEVMRDFRKALDGDEGEGWALVIPDPLSRFGGPDCETDNAAATRTIAGIETLTKAKGNPTVLVVHHSNKASRKEGERDGTIIRGVSALHDGVRWAATLTTETKGEIKALRFEVVKSNYGPPTAPITLVRDRGTLRVLRQSEIEEAKVRAESEATAELEARILDILASGPFYNEKEIRAELGGKMDPIQRAMGSLRRSGRIKKPGRGEPYEVIG